MGEEGRSGDIKIKEHIIIKHRRRPNNKRGYRESQEG